MTKMNQRRTVMGACDYSIQYLNSLKKSFMDLGNKNMETTWAVGGVVVTLTSNLIQMSDEVFGQSMQTGESDAKSDLLEIKTRFNAFIDRMLDSE